MYQPWMLIFWETKALCKCDLFSSVVPTAVLEDSKSNKVCLIFYASLNSRARVWHISRSIIGSEINTVFWYLPRKDLSFESFDSLQLLKVSPPRMATLPSSLIVSQHSAAILPDDSHRPCVCNIKHACLFIQIIHLKYNWKKNKTHDTLPPLAL